MKCKYSSSKDSLYLQKQLKMHKIKEKISSFEFKVIHKMNHQILYDTMVLGIEIRIIEIDLLYMTMRSSTILS